MNDASQDDDGSMERLATHASISDTLTRLTDEELVALLANAPRLHAGVGGRSLLLTIDSTPLFVKHIPLTDLERQPEHVRSTANIFDIPLSCHYGLGGPGFSAWRELAANLTATGWALSGACANFPLLYHWRVLPSDAEEVEGDVDFWLESPAVRARLEAIRNASAHLVLFCEYAPQNLLQWLSEQVGASAEAAEARKHRHRRPTSLLRRFRARVVIGFRPHRGRSPVPGGPPDLRPRSRRRWICPLSERDLLRQRSVEGASPRVREYGTATGPARRCGGHPPAGAAGARVPGVFA